MGRGDRKESPPGGLCGTQGEEGEPPPPEDRQGRACQHITPQCAGGGTALKSGE